jgi:hypothetical protein
MTEAITVASTHAARKTTALSMTEPPGVLLPPIVRLLPLVLPLGNACVMDMVPRPPAVPGPPRDAGNADGGCMTYCRHPSSTCRSVSALGKAGIWMGILSVTVLASDSVAGEASASAFTSSAAAGTASAAGAGGLAASPNKTTAKAKADDMACVAADVGLPNTRACMIRHRESIKAVSEALKAARTKADNKSSGIASNSEE